MVASTPSTRRRRDRDAMSDERVRASRGSRIATIYENTGAMFRDGLKNMAWGLSQQWIGGSQVMWLQEHVVLHHMHTGDVKMDPDAQMAPAMRGYSGSLYLPWMVLQHYYFFC